MISFTEFVGAFDIATDAANRLNSRAPLVEVLNARGKQLYCGWNLTRAVNIMAKASKASGFMHTFDVDGAPLFALPMPH